MSRFRDLKLNTTEYGFNIHFELFKSLQSYFSYYRPSRTSIGHFDRDPADETNTTVGLQVQRLPFRWMAEYEDITSNINPSRTVRSELDYRKNITSSVSLFGRLHYSNTDYPMGQFGTTEGYTETRYGADVRFQKIFFSPRLAITLGGAYTRNEGLSESETYALSGGLSLRMGRTEVLFTGRANHTDVEGTRQDQEQISELFYLTVKRRFF
jgi:hypothetical protein